MRRNKMENGWCGKGCRVWVNRQNGQMAEWLKCRMGQKAEWSNGRIVERQNGSKGRMYQWNSWWKQIIKLKINMKKK